MLTEKRRIFRPELGKTVTVAAGVDGAVAPAVLGDGEVQRHVRREAPRTMVCRCRAGDAPVAAMLSGDRGRAVAVRIEALVLGSVLPCAR